MFTSFQLQEIIADRYQLLDRLGRGGSGLTYRAKDLETDTLVALKILSLGQLEDWKKMELFDREAKILQQLDHPHIPQYLNHFQLNENGDSRFCLVQQLAPGKSLATLVEEGWRPTEEKVTAIADRVLEILVYLQDLIPPVIHRDIKPQNIIYHPEADELFLVDFGAVQDAYHQTAFGSTVVGTYGYMAPEQFRGQATLSTDLYGLATTLLFLLTGEPPSELSVQNLKLDFRNQVSISSPFANWIEKCIEPSSDDRFPNAEAALEVLRGNQAIEAYNSYQLRQPSYSSINLETTEDRLTVTIPPAISRQRRDRRFVILGTVWHLVLFLMVIGITVSTGYLWGALYAIGFLLSFSNFPYLKKENKGLNEGLISSGICLVLSLVLLSIVGFFILGFDFVGAIIAIILIIIVLFVPLKFFVPFLIKQAIIFVKSFSGLQGSKRIRSLLLIYTLLTFVLSFDPFFINLIGAISFSAIALDTIYGDKMRRAWFSDLLTITQLEIDPETFQVKVCRLDRKIEKQTTVLEAKEAFQPTAWYPMKIEKQTKVLQTAEDLKTNAFDPISNNQEVWKKESEFLYVGGLLTRAEKAWLWQEIQNF